MPPVSNNEAKLCFIDRVDETPTPISRDTTANIKDAIVMGLERCVQRKTDIDLHVCLQGTKYLSRENIMQLDIEGHILLHSTTETLHIQCDNNPYVLSVMMRGGSPPFMLEPEDASEDEAAVPPNNVDESFTSQESSEVEEMVDFSQLTRGRGAPVPPRPRAPPRAPRRHGYGI